MRAFLAGLLIAPVAVWLALFNLPSDVLTAQVKIWFVTFEAVAVIPVATAALIALFPTVTTRNWSLRTFMLRSVAAAAGGYLAYLGVVYVLSAYVHAIG